MDAPDLASPPAAAPAEPAPRLRAIAVLGPTAAGKSALGLALADRLGGRGPGAPAEIICCDSMQVYRGMDIGTGKPTPAEQARFAHHLLDVANPDQPFHAARWAEDARQVIAEVNARQGVPIIVGGTGLYFRALVRGLFEAPPSDEEIRRRHEAEAATAGVASLHARLGTVDPEAAARILPQDLLRISRALEIFEQTGVAMTTLHRSAPAPAPLDLFTVVLDPELPILRAAIDVRVDAMMAAGFLAEVQRLRAAGFGAERALFALGYRQLGLHLDGRLSLADAVAETKKATGGYARRQRTWFRKEDAAMRVAAVFDGADAALVDDIAAAVAARFELS